MDDFFTCRLLPRSLQQEHAPLVEDMIRQTNGGRSGRAWHRLSYFEEDVGGVHPRLPTPFSPSPIPVGLKQGENANALPYSEGGLSGEKLIRCDGEVRQGMGGHWGTMYG